MEHLHSVVDTDTRFSINPITRQIKNDSHKKIVLVQNDHNSEIFTFECPRIVEGHDMSLCNEVEIHFLNTGKNGSEKSGLYTVKDFKVDPEDESKVVCSWVIDRNATGIIGSLVFLVRYKCKEEKVITYDWHTEIFKEIRISDGINADERFEGDYVDVIDRWKDSVMSHFTAELTAWKARTAAEVKEEAFEEIATERKRIDNLFAFVTPEMFGAIGDGVADDTDAMVACLAYADDNMCNVTLKNNVYCISKPLATNLGYIIYGHNGVLKATAQMDAILTINKNSDMGADANYNGCSAIYDLNIDGNSLATNGLCILHGKSITIKNIRIKSATHAQMAITPNGSQQVWELLVDNVELRGAYANGYSAYGLLITGTNTDSYYRNVLIINTATAWMDSNSAVCTFENFHGYGYPAELGADIGFVFRGNANMIRGFSVDTPTNKGIIVEGDFNTFSLIHVANVQSETGIGIQVSGNANTFDGVECSAPYCFYITSGENTIDEFKCMSLYSTSEYDYYFTGKLPYRGIFDTKTRVTNNIKRNFTFYNQWFYQSVLTMQINFENEFRYNNYDVHIIGVDESAPNYSLEKTTTGCVITCTDAITKGRKVNVVIDSPNVCLI